MAATVATSVPADRESGQAGESVAAVTPFHKKKREQKYGRRDNGHKGGNAATTSDRKASDLCQFHWKWGEEAFSTSSGRVVQLQAEAQKPAPAPLTNCSQSGQPTRAVIAIAADQPPGCPRFIALPPKSIGSVILDEFP